MKSAVFIASLYATVALANPVKRYLVTTVEVETVTVYVTDGQPAPTSTDAQFFAAPSPAPAVPTTDSPSWETWSSAAAPAPAPSAASGGDYSGLSDYAVPIMQQHNLHRANHSAPALEWDDDLASIAQQIAETCVYAHNT